MSLNTWTQYTVYWICAFRQPKEEGLPTTAYYAKDEIREVCIRHNHCLNSRILAVSRETLDHLLACTYVQFGVEVEPCPCMVQCHLKQGVCTGRYPKEPEGIRQYSNRSWSHWSRGSRYASSKPLQQELLSTYPNQGCRMIQFCPCLISEVQEERGLIWNHKMKKTSPEIWLDGAPYVPQCKSKKCMSQGRSSAKLYYITLEHHVSSDCPVWPIISFCAWD